MRLTAVLLLIVAVSSPGASTQSAPNESCAISPVVRDFPPPDENADSVGPADWYLNEDRTIWAGPVPDSGWMAGGTLYSGNRIMPGRKTYWVRPRGTELLISGRRVDADGPGVEAHVPCCYGSGFQIVGLFFPTAGCWEVTAKAGDKELRFVTIVHEEVRAASLR